MTQLDQFFTKPEVASLCWEQLVGVLAELTGRNLDSLFFVEPSAGAGDFYDILPPERRLGIDLEPRRPEFVRDDFLDWQPHGAVPAATERVAVVGNPPFGKRGKMAVHFFRRASLVADTIGFIVPVIFRKYFIHKQLPSDFRWIHSVQLPRSAFWTDAHKNHAVNTEFQVWTRLPTRRQDHRLHEAPPIRHPDFQLFQYNNTEDALKVFDEDFNFAVPCQGWQDYTRRERSADRCETYKQWMLIKARNFTALHRLYARIDYGELATIHTTSVPGFRKGDLVSEYTKRYG